MTREIKFRGKRIDNNEWVYGSLLIEAYNCYISKKVDQTREAITQISVYKESVGQFTGLKDKNGVEIYEGDMMKYGNYIFTVNFVSHKFVACFENYINPAIDISKYEVIGNIHETS